MHRFDIKRSKMLRYVAKHSKQRKTTKVIKLQINCSDLMSKRSNQRKTTKSDLISMNWDRFDVKTIKTFELGRKTFKTTENYKTDQLQWIALTWGQNDQKNPKLQTQSNNKQFASIWHQNDQNNAKLRKWSDYNALHRFDV